MSLITANNLKSKPMSVSKTLLRIEVDPDFRAR
jgi:hypothetical protein